MFFCCVSSAHSYQKGHNPSNPFYDHLQKNRELLKQQKKISNQKPQTYPFDLCVNKSFFHIQLASNDQQRAQGLMGRENLKKNQGMLFVFPYNQFVYFWMKNTPIDLDIAYINAQGVIQEIHHLKHESTKIVASAKPVRYALEVKQGVLAAHHIQKGDQLFWKN